MSDSSALLVSLRVPLCVALLMDEFLLLCLVGGHVFALHLFWNLIPPTHFSVDTEHLQGQCITGTKWLVICFFFRSSQKMPLPGTIFGSHECRNVPFHSMLNLAISISESWQIMKRAGRASLSETETEGEKASSSGRRISDQ